MGEIVWSLLSSIAIFNSTVKLKCMVPKDICCDTYRRNWYKGLDLKTILINGDSTDTDSTKYSEEIANDGFILVIENLSLEDVKDNYTCGYKFEKYTQPFPISKFELHPTKDTLETVFDVNDKGEFNISVAFQKVYPRPKCTLTIDGGDKSSEVMEQHSKGDNEDLYYSAKVLYNGICKSQFSFYCKVGQNYTFSVAQKCTNSSDAGRNDIALMDLPWFLLAFSAPVVSLLLISVVFVFVGYIVSWTCKGRHNSHGNIAESGEQLQNLMREENNAKGSSEGVLQNLDGHPNNREPE